MFWSIILSGLALGATYTLIAITYNVMFSASRMMSFTAGQVGMLGGILGAGLISVLGWPSILALLATVLCCALLGLLVELVAIRPVLGKIEQHLYVLSTLAFAILIQQLTALGWSTEPRPFPRVVDMGNAILDEKFWLPVAACVAAYLGMELLYRRTLVGRAFLAVAEDNYTATALGLPGTQLRMISFAIAGGIGGLAGFASGQLLLAFFANGHLLTFYGFIPVALGSVGNNKGALITGVALGLLQQTADYVVGGVFASVVIFLLFIVAMLVMPQGIFGASHERRV